MAYDPNAKRRSLASLADSGQYPGAIGPLPSLASLLPTGSTAPFNDSVVDLNRPYFGGQRQAAGYGPAASTPSPAQAVPPAVRTAVPAPVAPAVAPPLANAVQRLSPQQRAQAPLQSVPLGPNNLTVPPPQYNGNSFDLAGQNARMAAVLGAPQGAAEPAFVSPPPSSPGRGIAGDFDFADMAALKFAAQSSDPKERAKIPGMVAYLDKRDEVSAGTKATADYVAKLGAQSGANERNALAGFTTTQAQDLAATRGGRLAGLAAGVGKTQADTGNIFAQTADLNTLRPGKVLGQTADISRTNALAGLAGAQAGEAGQHSELLAAQAGLANENTNAAALTNKQAKQIEALRVRAISGDDPKAEKQFAAYIKANAGKGDGSITEEDIIHAFVNDRKAQAANPAAGGALPTYSDFKAQILGNAGAKPPENHILALKQNPAMAKDFDAKYGAGASAQYLKAK